MNYIITSSTGDYTSDLIKNLDGQEEIRVLTNQQIKEENITIEKTDKFYMPSDTVYSTIRDHIDPYWQKIIDSCRDKYQFRENLKKLYPEFIYDKIDLNNLDAYPFDFEKREKYVVKPTIGFMAGGARIITRRDDLTELKKAIQDELEKFSALYPNIFSKEILIEEYIGDGDEYAVDMYYGEDGKPCIINIYNHPTSKRPEYLQLLYYASKALFDDYYESFYQFFENFNKDGHITSFPIHAEFKLNAKGELIPIEFNVCRFGGMGVADLVYYSTHHNPVLFYFQNKTIDWKSFWKHHSEDLFCWAMGYNAAEKDIRNYWPNHNVFKEMLPKGASVLNYIALDYKKMPAFAIVYLKTQNSEDLKQILSLEFNDCFELIE